MYLLAILLLLLPPCLPLEVKPLSVPAFPGAEETNFEPTTTEVNTSCQVLFCNITTELLDDPPKFVQP